MASGSLAETLSDEVVRECLTLKGLFHLLAAYMNWPLSRLNSFLPIECSGRQFTSASDYCARLARLLDLPQIQISSENDFVIASNLAAFCCGKTPRIGSESDPVVGNARRVCFSEG